MKRLAFLFLLAGIASGQPAPLSPCRLDGTGCFTIAYSNITGISASRLLGRGSSGGGAAQEITLGTGLSMSGTTLSASGGGGGTPGGSDGQVQYNSSGSFAGSAKFTYDDTAPTFRLWGLATDGSNYERLAISASAGTGFTIAAESGGAGAANLDVAISPKGTGTVTFDRESGTFQSFLISGVETARIAPGVIGSVGFVAGAAAGSRAGHGYQLLVNWSYVIPIISTASQAYVAENGSHVALTFDALRDGILFGNAQDAAIERAEAGLVKVTSGIQYITGTRPTCDATHRGTTWYVAGGAGVADTFEVCRKDSGDSYAWVTLF